MWRGSTLWLILKGSLRPWVSQPLLRGLLRVYPAFLPGGVSGAQAPHPGPSDPALDLGLSFTSPGLCSTLVSTGPMSGTKGGAGVRGWGRRDHADQLASWSLGVTGSRNLHGRKRRLKIIRKGRVRREELGNGGWRARWSGEIMRHPFKHRRTRAHMHTDTCASRTLSPRGHRTRASHSLSLPLINTNPLHTSCNATTHTILTACLIHTDKTEIPLQRQFSYTLPSLRRSYPILCSFLWPACGRQRFQARLSGRVQEGRAM